MIYICIPVHEEARTIGVLLWKIRKVMRDFGRDYEVLVLDDASGDDTAETLARYRKILPLSVITGETRRGYGAAVETLIREALDRTEYPKRDAVVTIQGDFTEHPEYIVTLVKALEGGADVVTGTVEPDLRGVPRSVRFARWMAPFVLGGTLKAAPVSDPLSGFRAYRLIVLKKALRALGERRLIDGEGWAANIELLSLASAHARRIEEVPLDLRYDIRTRESRFSAVRTLRHLLRVRNPSLWNVEGEKAS